MAVLPDPPLHDKSRLKRRPLANAWAYRNLCGNRGLIVRMRSVCTLLLSAITLFGQAPTAPVLDQRGLLNGFTKLPAPATVGRGGILDINGFNLGPPEGATASALPLPATLGGMQVTINGRPAPLFSVTPGRIVAQVPWDAALGMAQVVVVRGNTRSRPGRFTVSVSYTHLTLPTIYSV